jgi:hypothetical protein
MAAIRKAKEWYEEALVITVPPKWLSFSLGA